MSLFRREKRARGFNGTFSNIFGSSRTQKAGGDVAKNLPLVIGVFNGIADSIAQCSVRVHREVDGVSVPTKNPKWIDTPNSLQTRFQFWEQVAQSLLYYGNAYIYKLKVKGRLAELHVLHPDDVEVTQEKRFGPTNFHVQGIEEVLTSHDILHIKAYGGPESLYGISPVQQAKIFVDTAYAAQGYSAQLHENNLNLSGIIELPQKPGKDLNTDEAARIGKLFAASHRPGAEGGSPIGVLGGGATFKTVSLTPEQAQFIESERWNAQKFATLLNVPLPMVDASAGSWAGTGLQVMNAVYEQRTLQPWIKRIEDAISTFLLPTGQSLKFNISVVLRSSPKEQADIFAKNVGVPIMTVNEARAIINLPPVEGGDKLAAQNWFTAREDLDKQADLNQQKTQQEIENLGDDESPGGEK